ncbi:unnamed protein product [Sympodiomycopsis kandeliae]
MLNTTPTFLQPSQFNAASNEENKSSAPVLRRKRSSAIASLTTRPSIKTLREAGVDVDKLTSSRSAEEQEQSKENRAT